MAQEGAEDAAVSPAARPDHASQGPALTTDSKLAADATPEEAAEATPEEAAAATVTAHMISDLSAAAAEATAVTEQLAAGGKENLSRNTSQGTPQCSSSSKRARRPLNRHFPAGSNVKSNVKQPTCSGENEDTADGYYQDREAPPQPRHKNGEAPSGAAAARDAKHAPTRGTSLDVGGGAVPAAPALPPPASSTTTAPPPTDNGAQAAAPLIHVIPGVLSHLLVSLCP